MEAIFKRRSIRKYTEKRVSEEVIERLLRAGMAEPSARNEQPWHFVVIDDKQVLNEIPKIHPYSQMLKEASHAVIVCGDVSIAKEYWVQDCSAAMENMLLMAVDLGLGAVWLGVYPGKERVKGLKELLDLPENIMPLSIMSIGYPAETKESADRFDSSRIHRNKW